ncbi:MAG: DUF3179 domain-containing protein [Desulfovibrionaceae bacterium]|nr:DUF3179 domain-containing protein [Desulfovibrionaceae bacterium]
MPAKYSINSLEKIMTFLLLAICLLGIPQIPAQAAESKASEAPGFSMDSLRFIADNLIHTGVGRDSITPIYRPAFLNVSDAGLSMDDNEPVFVVHYPGGLTRIYPQYIMVWHEVVNDVLPGLPQTAPSPGEGDPAFPSAFIGQFQNQTQGGGSQAEDTGNSYTISYSPLTGSVVAFRSRGGRYPSSFGNEGKLYNSNSILYDRFSGSLWSQLLAVCIEGPLRGRRLERIPVYWARWGGVKYRFPDAQVLSRATGMKRSYGRDPYGSYMRGGSYYDDVRLFYPVASQSDRLPPKARILGLEIEEMYGALVVDAVRREKILNQGLGLHHIVAIHDAELDRIRVFNRKRPDGSILSFQVFENNYVDRDTMSQWNSDGECYYGRLRGQRLEPIMAVDSMWFAWYAFHPATQVLDREGSPPPPIRRSAP